jgi:hypothetical protein
MAVVSALANNEGDRKILAVSAMSRSSIVLITAGRNRSYLFLIADHFLKAQHITQYL